MRKTYKSDHIGTSPWKHHHGCPETSVWLLCFLHTTRHVPGKVAISVGLLCHHFQAAQVATANAWLFELRCLPLESEMRCLHGQVARWCYHLKQRNVAVPNSAHGRMSLMLGSFANERGVSTCSTTWEERASILGMWIISIQRN